MGVRGPPLEYWGAGFFFEIHVNSFVEKIGQINKPPQGMGEIQPEAAPNGHLPQFHNKRDEFIKITKTMNYKRSRTGNNSAIIFKLIQIF